MRPSLVVVLTLAVATSACAQGGSNEFRWIDPDRDQAVWARATAAVAGQVVNSLSTIRENGTSTSRDDPGEFPDRVERVAVSGESALIVYGDGEWGAQGSEYFALFSYDLESDSLVRISRTQGSSSIGIWARWAPVRAAVLGQDLTLLFTFHDCSGCEARQWLAGVHISEGHWAFRRLGGTQDIFVGSDIQISDSGLWSHECAFAVADLNGDTRVDVGTYCRGTETKDELRDGEWVMVPGRTTLEALLFDVGGESGSPEVMAEAEREALLRAICRHLPDQGLCTTG